MRTASGNLTLVSDPLWYRDAVIYQLHVKAFKDADGDGVGDFRGLSDCLDYVADLGVNALWLLPFYPSPMRDDGYDVADYRGIHPSYGTRSDFRRFVRQAHRRGIRIITELVINHTSDQHPWFQASRHAPRGSAKRNYYVWSDSDKRYAGTRIIFSDTETSNWAWDPVARQYYWHRFFSHQPDLNFDNPSVVKAVIRVMRFWLDMGVDGLRLDAIPYLCEREGSDNENLPETHAVLRHMRAVVDAHYEQRVLLAEANQWPEDVREYFGDGDECHMAYHFPLMPRMYMALAQEDRYPVVEILEQTPDIPGSCQWALFLRNHDELTLEMVTDEERDYMYASYASDPRARINVGIRRRLAPLLDNDLDRIKLLNSLLLSMPGAPIIYYGDEIGMGDNIFLGDRNAVRTPMQWSPERNAGFSRADPQQLYLPPVMDPVYGYDAVNVEAQSRHGYSLLNWTRRLIAVRKTSQAFGRGSLSLLAPGNRHVLAYLREHEDEVILCVANLSRTAQPVELDLARFRGLIPVEMMGRSVFPPVGDLPYLLTLSGHGFFWFLLTQQAEIPDWHVAALPRTDLVTLVLRNGWQTFFPEQLPQTWRASAVAVAHTFTSRALPGFLQAGDWLAEQASAIGPWSIERRILWRTDTGSYLLLWVRHGDGSPSTEACFLALAIAWGGDRESHIRERLPMALARVREHARVGVLYEAFRDDDFCHALLAAMNQSASHADAEGKLQFVCTAFGREVLGELPADAAWQMVPGEKRAAVVELDQQLRLKVSRCGEAALQTQFDIGRFLTEQGVFHSFPRLVGALLSRDGDRASPLVVAEALVSHQGDAWHYVTLYLQRFLEDAQLRPLIETQQLQDALHAANDSWLHTLGRRTGELHLALAAADAPWPPRPVGPADLQTWTAAAQHATAALVTQLGAAAAEPPLLASLQAGLLQRIAAGRFRGVLSRCHGNHHLGRVLVAQNDVIITGFEDDPMAPGPAAQHSPLRDVARMLCSLERAAHWSLQAAAEVQLGEPQTSRVLALDWLTRARRAFLGGYFDVTAGADLFGPTLQDAAPLLELFVLEMMARDFGAELEHDAHPQPTALLARLCYQLEQGVSL